MPFLQEKIIETYGGSKMETIQKTKTTRISTILIATIVMISLIAGGVLGYSGSNLSTSGTINDLRSQVSTLQGQVADLQSTQNITYQYNTYILDENVSLSKLYAQVKDSVVTIRGVTVQYDVFYRPYYTQIQGSGFVYNFSGHVLIVTNYHVVQKTINITITFADGDKYSTSVLGYDPYEDLATLSANVPATELKPLEIASSSALEVGDPVIAVGNPYGLAGSMTTGIVSALGRTITEEMTGGYPIASVIQTSTPINPGNSGGPLLNYQGQVVGITTAIVTDSQGLGFAVPSNTILREIDSLVTEGSYSQHPSLGASGTDMTYEIAKAMNTDATYGWLIVTSNQTNLQGGTRQVVIAGEIVTIGGDIITAIGENRIRNIDDLSTYLEEHTLPGQTIDVTIVRGNETMTVPVKLKARPSTQA
jgi:S1-C subfamily serine protease